jgi:hypothetical protein|tara:strand:- start:864 stop:1100 length:237 start_codon:yes stop_codon:yes gene_type:complete
MSYIHDPNGVLGAQSFPYLTIGSLVYYGPVTNAGKNGKVGIIIDVHYSNLVAGDCMFYIYAEGAVIETAMVYPFPGEI